MTIINLFFRSKTYNVFIQLRTITTILILITTYTSVQGQTTLTPGDIAITGYNQHSHDANGYAGNRSNGEFSFVLLKSVESGTIIYFTDHGVNDNNTTLMTGDANSEGNITWTASSNFNSGTHVLIQLDDDGNPTASEGSTSVLNGKIELGEEKGDQILVYQGNPTSPTYLFAINWDNRNWNGRNNRKEETELPTGLIDGISALHISDQQAHAQYDCSVTTGGATVIHAAISNSNNWNLATHNGNRNDNGNYLALANCSFIFNLTTTWQGSFWDNGVPNLAIDAVIAGDYGVVSVDDSFSCKTLTVNADAMCRVRWNKHIEVENNISVSGILLVTTQGSVVQNNPNGTVTVFGNGKIQNEKITSLANNFYEYTYWSSPVSNETVGSGLAEAQPGSKYSFNAANFVDATMESNNNNETVAGQDDIDDNGDDWTSVNDATLMTPGIGYVSMHSSNNFLGQGTQYKYTFEGPFNNGTITVPIHRNDSETEDINWNLIGNPYPSAIDADLFFAANTFVAPDNSNVSYQNSNGNSNYNTGITYVELNGISNQDLVNTNNNGYENATNIQIPVNIGSSYNLNVKVNTEGNYTSHTFAWIDWNRDGDFDDNNETYDLGDDTNKYDILTTSSPYTIEVPSFAVIGTTRMRISSKYNGNPGSEETGFDGEVEDYSIIVSNSSGGLDNAIFLWSQNTPPSSNNNGNQAINFSSSDYAVINNVGETAGGDGIIPNRFIPSGQSFFVSFNDEATPNSTSGNISQSSVVFTNTMRVLQNNQQFFRSSIKKNKMQDKLWLNLTSDNGVFNQILIAYVDGATNQDDGMSFDTPKNLATGAAAILYSMIADDLGEKYVIQAKNKNSINENEIIKIGYKTEINIPTIYNFSIDKLEGNFLSNNQVYLKDNLLNVVHSIKNSDYRFTSVDGEFNDRFEIVFSENSLSLKDIIIKPSSILIIEQPNGDVQFKLNENGNIRTMKNIQIMDINGRNLYTFGTNSADETLRLSNLSNGAYIAKITLDNNSLIVKKAIKKY